MLIMPKSPQRLPLVQSVSLELFKKTHTNYFTRTLAQSTSLEEAQKLLHYNIRTNHFTSRTLAQSTSLEHWCKLLHYNGCTEHFT
jgi:hypothetical protein